MKGSRAYCLNLKFYVVNVLCSTDIIKYVGLCSYMSDSTTENVNCYFTTTPEAEMIVRISQQIYLTINVCLVIEYVILRFWLEPKAFINRKMCSKNVLLVSPTSFHYLHKVVFTVLLAFHNSIKAQNKNKYVTSSSSSLLLFAIIFMLESTSRKTTYINLYLYSSESK